jgi:hypothetical protein
MKKRGMRSPDLTDAFLLIFACGERRKQQYRKPEPGDYSAWAVIVGVCQRRLAQRVRTPSVAWNSDLAEAWHDVLLPGLYRYTVSVNDWSEAYPWLW